MSLIILYRPDRGAALATQSCLPSEATTQNIITGMAAATLLHSTSLLLPKKYPKSKVRRSHVSPRMSLQNPKSGDDDFITSISRILWGKSLPPQILISAVRSTWSTVWHLMMKQMAPSDPKGSYSRPGSSFRVESYRQSNGRYHLYASLACPWAHRTLIVRALKGLEHEIPISIASPSLDGSWEFRESRDLSGESKLVPSVDRANGCTNLKQVYRLRKGGYDGRSTVPMLWDLDKKDVFCNESYDIIEFFNSGFEGLNSGFDLSPPALKRQIEEWNRIIHPKVNNGVYRCGFAQSQEAYDDAVSQLFSTLDVLDEHLSTSTYLCGDDFTLADVCLFTTMIRFDLVYNVLFKCTRKKLVEYPNLYRYTCDIYQIPKIADTCNFNAIMDGYFRILFPLNPSGIKPVMPSSCENDFLFKVHNTPPLPTTRKQSEALVSTDSVQ